MNAQEDTQIPFYSFHRHTRPCGSLTANKKPMKGVENNKKICHLQSRHLPETKAFSVIHTLHAFMWIHRRETSTLLCFAQRHEMATPLFHFLPITPCLPLLPGQLFFREHRDRILVSNSAWSTSITYYSSSPRQEVWVDTLLKQIKKQMGASWLWQWGVHSVWER